MTLNKDICSQKLVFLGDEGVGKTSIITSFMYGKLFDVNYQATIGIDFLSKTMKFENRIIHLQLWDTAGQERFRSLLPNYIRNSSVAVIVYDVTNKKSFINTCKWIQNVRIERGNNVTIVLVGNKTDLVHQRQVSIEEGETKAIEYGAMFIETSARFDSNIKLLFRKIAATLLGIGTVSPTKEEDFVDVNLTNSFQREQYNSVCSCS